METISEGQADTSGVNPPSVKSEDSTPPPDTDRGSPPPNCAICLGTCKNKSFTDSCLHQFCFSCLLTWSKVKAECPLCKQNFKSIIHNVRSNHQYEEYMVEQRHTEEQIDISGITGINHSTRRFRYRTTLTFPRRESRAIEQLLLHYPLVPALYPPPPAHRRRRDTASFRRTVYRHNLWARPLPDFTGRFRDCSPEFYRYNDAQMHRLVPWLNRELNYLLNENIPHIGYVMARILELLPLHHITSPEFREAMHYFGERTEHFLHELYCFASTPYDMTGYDRNVQYTTDPRISTMVNEVLSSSESDSRDSDIVMVSMSEPGPSRPPPAAPAVVPIESISHSDSDSGSEVMVVGYIKPPQDRTPEVVDLLGSDSDVVVAEPPPAAAAAAAAPSAPAAPLSTPLVKVSLSRRRRRSPHAWRPWSRSPTPAAAPIASPPASPATPTSPTSCSSSSSSATSSSAFSCSSNSSDSDSPLTETDSSSAESARRRRRRRKPRLKAKRPVKRARTDRRASAKRVKVKRNRATQTLRKTDTGKHKAKSSKDVKSSKKKEEVVSVPSPASTPPPPPLPPPPPPPDADQPSTSGLQQNVKKKKSKSSRDERHRSSRERKKLKSVVKVIDKPETGNNSSWSNLLNIVESEILNPNSNVLSYNSDSGSVPSEGRTKRSRRLPSDLLERVDSCFNVESGRIEQDTSSDDDTPLNLTIKRK